MQQKIIAHIDLDCYFVSVERISNPSLRGKPVIVGGHPSKRGVVASASYEARAFGIRSAMPTFRALQLCPKVILVEVSHGEYGKISKLIYNRLCDFAPIVEKASIDEMYLDLTGCEKIYNNDWNKFLLMLQQTIDSEFQLPCSIAIASSKTISKIATGTVKPHGLIHLKNGEEKEFLSKLDISVIPGIGEKTELKLKSYGINKIEDLQNCKPDFLKTLLGDYSEYIIDIVQGGGSTEVSNYDERKSISSEETFEKDISDLELLKQKLFELAEKVSTILRKKKLATKTVRLKLRFSDFIAITRMKGIEKTFDDKIIYQNLLKLLEENFSKKQPIRLLGAGVTNLVSQEESDMTLFEDEKRTKVLKTVDVIKNKFGDDAIHTGKL